MGIEMYTVGNDKYKNNEFEIDKKETNELKSKDFWLYVGILAVAGAAFFATKIYGVNNTQKPVESMKSDKQTSYFMNKQVKNITQPSKDIYTSQAFNQQYKI